MATLREYLKNLQEEYKPQPSPEPETDLTVQDTLKMLVKALQTELNRQCGAGLVVDGIFGPCTKAAIFNVGAGRQGNITRTLQGLLICNGFSPRGFTGYFGAGTEGAVREFQYRAGLYIDGVAGKETFAALCA